MVALVVHKAQHPDLGLIDADDDVAPAKRRGDFSTAVFPLSTLLPTWIQLSPAPLRW